MVSRNNSRLYEGSVPLSPDVDIIPNFPVIVHRESVQSEWIDYNGHMNVAYYVLAFDHATDRVFALLDLGIDYVRRTNCSAFVLETHVTYQREVHEGTPLDFKFQLIDADEKRIHLYFEMLHGEDGWVSATSELIVLHVNLSSRRSVKFNEDTQKRLDVMFNAHRHLDLPSGVGRSIGMHRKKS